MKSNIKLSNAKTSSSIKSKSLTSVTSKPMRMSQKINAPKTSSSSIKSINTPTLKGTKVLKNISSPRPQPKINKVALKQFARQGRKFEIQAETHFKKLESGKKSPRIIRSQVHTISGSSLKGKRIDLMAGKQPISVKSTKNINRIQDRTVQRYFKEAGGYPNRTIATQKYKSIPNFKGAKVGNKPLLVFPKQPLTKETKQRLLSHQKNTGVKPIFIKGK